MVYEKPSKGIIPHVDFNAKLQLLHENDHATALTG